jgi:hypothetical protein
MSQFADRIALSRGPLCPDVAEWIVGQTIMVNDSMAIPSPYVRLREEKL